MFPDGTRYFGKLQHRVYNPSKTWARHTENTTLQSRGGRARSLLERARDSKQTSSIKAMRHGRSPPVSETIAGCSDCPPLAGVLDSRCQGDDSKPGGLTPLKNNTCCVFSSGPCLLTSIYSGEGALSAAVWLHFNCAIFLLFAFVPSFFSQTSESIIPGIWKQRCSSPALRKVDVTCNHITPLYYRPCLRGSFSPVSQIRRA